MAIPLPPAAPSPLSATFGTDALAFTQWMHAFGTALPDEIARLNGLGVGAFTASSATSMTIGTGSKSLTIETGKGFAVGQVLMLASTASPTNYMTGQVTSYNSGTGALEVNVTSAAGSGTIAAWTVSVTAVVAGGGVSPDSIVVLTSGTSWTCPAGVTKVVGRVEGGCGGGGGGNGSLTAAAGGGGGGVMFVAGVTPGTAYTYAIGAGGAGATATNGWGATGGSTTMTISGVTYTGTGGGGGGGGNSGPGGTGGNGSGDGAMPVLGHAGNAASSHGTSGGTSAFGFGVGGTSAASYGNAGSGGRIVLELYK